MSRLTNNQEISRDYEECSQCEIIASDEVVINGELYWLCEQHLKEHTSDFNKNEVID